MASANMQSIRYSSHGPRCICTNCGKPFAYRRLFLAQTKRRVQFVSYRMEAECPLCSEHSSALFVFVRCTQYIRSTASLFVRYKTLYLPIEHAPNCFLQPNIHTMDAKKSHSRSTPSVNLIALFCILQRHVWCGSN